MERARTKPTADDREQVIGLEVGTYASQPILSSNGRHIAYVAWNKNTETPLYKEDDDKNNAFLNKNSIWIYDIQKEEKHQLMDFGNNRIIDHFGTWTVHKGKDCPLARLSQMYDTLNKISIDAIISPKATGERKLAAQHCKHLQANSTHPLCTALPLK